MSSPLASERLPIDPVIYRLRHLGASREILLSVVNLQHIWL